LRENANYKTITGIAEEQFVMRRFERLVSVLFFALGSAVANTANAQTHYAPVEVIVQSLAKEASGPMVRSMIQATGKLPLAAVQQIPAGFDLPSINLTVEFDGDSHFLTTNGMTALRGLAVALSNPKLANSRFQVGSHMYQQGSTNATTVTSRRAAVVVDHLVTFYDIDRNRLLPVGYGSAKMHDLTVPTNPLNERIELINVDDLQ
jgi:outer membrane protein OmpA-like peptidoglycan-associated protein